MAHAYHTETVLTVRHWTDSYFSFTTTRKADFRFDNGQFVMIGLTLPDAQRPLLRAYSIASANWEEQLEFFSIKLPYGPLTSRLQHIQPGDSVLVGEKPTGTLLISDLHPAKHLFLLGTGTGLAPWLSIIKDPETYERFDKVIVVHGVRYENDLAYRDTIASQFKNHDFLGSIVGDCLLYYPVVSRESFTNHGRLTDHLRSGQMHRNLGLGERMCPSTDRYMLCGSTQMLNECRNILNTAGFQPSQRIGQLGDYVYERAFVTK